MGSSPVGGGLALPLPLPRFTRGRCFRCLGFLLIQIKRRAGAICRWTRRFARLFSTDVVRPQASKWADPKERHSSLPHDGS